MTWINYRRPSIPISEVNDFLQESCYWINQSLSQATKKKKKWNIKKGERKKGKLSQRTRLMFLHKALCSQSVTSCRTSLHNFYSTPGKGKGLTHLWELGHCCSPHGYRLCTWTLSFHTNNYKIQKPYRQKFCNSHSHLYKQV